MGPDRTRETTPEGDADWVNEQREHARVEADIRCTVDGTTEGRIRNLSQGGALLFAPVGLGEMDDTLSLEFQVGEAEGLTVFAEVLRVVSRAGETEYGLHFVALSAAHLERLRQCVVALADGRGVGRRYSPRLCRRVTLRCVDVDAFRATLNDISRGGLGLECEVPVSQGDELSVEILVGPQALVVELRGVVAHAHQVGPVLHRVGLEFEPLTSHQRERLDAVVQWMLYDG